MSLLKAPYWLNQHLFEYDPEEIAPKLIEQIRKGIKRYTAENPELSIVIPAYNEEASMLNTLSSFAKMDLPVSTELIVANNNSTDATAKILEACGVQSVFIKDKGISYARQGGLEAAKAPIILSADSDSIYPPNWIQAYLKAFNANSNLVCAYGTYHFIPSEYAGRFSLSLYEKFSALKFNMRKGREECKNVMGFNFAYKKDAAEKIGGFKHDLNRAETGRSEDGWMAWELFELGDLEKVEAAKAWTDTRRLEEDGSILQAFMKRITPVLK